MKRTPYLRSADFITEEMWSFQEYEGVSHKTDSSTCANRNMSPFANLSQINFTGTGRYVLYGQMLAQPQEWQRLCIEDRSTNEM